MNVITDFQSLHLTDSKSSHQEDHSRPLSAHTHTHTHTQVYTCTVHVSLDTVRAIHMEM